MKYLYKISSIVATLALVVGLSFSASIAQNANSQQNTLQGKVVDSQSSQAIANAKVTITKAKAKKMGSMKTDTSKVNNQGNMGSKQRSKEATTKKDGSFKIQNIPSGIYTIKVKADGYKTWTKQATINNDAKLTIKLKPSQQ